MHVTIYTRTLEMYHLTSTRWFLQQDLICQLDLDPNKRFRALSSPIKNSQEETSGLLQRKSKCNSLYPTQNTAAG